MRVLPLASFLITACFALTAQAQVPKDAPRDFPTRFASKDTSIRREAAKAYARGCKGRQRHQFRRAPEGWQGYQQLLKDKNADVVLAALAMTTCFKANKNLPLLADLSQHKSLKVMHEALTLLAHMENVAALSSFGKWLKEKSEFCASTKQNKLDLCHLALYGLGQSSQHSATDATERILAGDILKPFLKDSHPKTRKVAAMALILGGALAHKKEVEKLLENENAGHFSQTNSPENLQAISSLLAEMGR